MLVPSITDAYKALKRIVYRENLDFIARLRLAQFESEEGFEERLNALQSIVEAGRQQILTDSDSIDELLGAVSFYLLPKKVESLDESETDQGYLTNKRTSDTGYQVSEVSYFIDLPVELRVLDTLWVMTAGRLLDSNLPDTLYANRLVPATNAAECVSSDVFKFYVTQYGKWRDTAITTAVDLLEKHNSSAALFSLDIKQYYYNVRLDYAELRESLNVLCKESCNADEWLLVVNLTDLLQELHERYAAAIGDCLAVTHPGLHNKNQAKLGDEHSMTVLPIGLPSSQVLSNWYLREFDERVVRELSPAFYGRYVDDVMIVLQDPVIETSSDTRARFVERYLKGLIDCTDDGYTLMVPDGLRVQKEKLLLHYYDKNHSQAGLKYFLKELERQNSAFRFLPGSEVDQEIDEIAYDLIREGSVRKLRSITGLRENSTELSKYLTMQIIAHRLSDETKPKGERILDQLFKFFQGKNFLDFCRLWEKVFSFTIIENRFEDAYRFYQRAQSLFKQLSYPEDRDGRVLSKLEQSVQSYLDVSLAMPCGLLELADDSGFKSRHFRELLFREQDITAMSIRHKARAIRRANLIRHNYVAYPMTNYTRYEGSLLELDWRSIFRLAAAEDGAWLDQVKMDYTPRYVHLDELQLSYFLQFLTDPEKDGGWSLLGTDRVKSSGYTKVDMPEPALIHQDGPKAYRIKVAESGKAAKLVVAIANMRVDERDIEASYRGDKKPNVSQDRQDKLYCVLNAAEKEHADMLVFPEVSIPHCWLPTMVAHSRRHQIALVFGLEHWVVDNRAYNLIVTTLPFRTSVGHDACLVCIRTKNHYAPQEIVDLKRVRLLPVQPEPSTYHLISWRGIQFAPYNCFELADIGHRGLFRSELDVLVACVWNRDKPYYNNIMESAVRDLHCYVVEANTSAYGGSCILQPTKNEAMDMVRVKGGDNTCILTATLDIQKLREFQFHEYSEVDTTFKPTPPGFNHESVIRRGT